MSDHPDHADHRRSLADLAGLGFETRAVHGGGGPDPATGAVNTPGLPVVDVPTGRRGPRTAASSTHARATPVAPASRPIWPCSRGPPSGSPSPAGWRPRTPCLRLLGPGDHLVMPTDSYGGTYRLATRSTAGPGSRSTPSTCPGWTRPCGPRRAWSGSRRRRTRSSNVIDIAAVAELAHSHGAYRRRRQHLRHTLAPAAPRPRAPTSWCTRRPSTWAGTPTSSAGSRPPTTPTWRSASGSSRTRPARCPGPSTATWCSAGS